MNWRRPARWPCAWVDELEKAAANLTCRCAPAQRMRILNAHEDLPPPRGAMKACRDSLDTGFRIQVRARRHNSRCRSEKEISPWSVLMTSRQYTMAKSSGSYLVRAIRPSEISRRRGSSTFSATYFCQSNVSEVYGSPLASCRYFPATGTSYSMGS